MEEVHFLVVEDDSRWQELLRDLLKRFDPQAKIDIATNYEQALHQIHLETYDLVTIDFMLPNAYGSNEMRVGLLDELRTPRHDLHGCGLIVLSGHGSVQLSNHAFGNYHIDQFLEKGSFNDNEFLPIVMRTLRDARLRGAIARADMRHRLSITVDQGKLVSSQLNGPKRQSQTPISPPFELKMKDLVRRTDNLNRLIVGAQAKEWREEADSIGRQLYQEMTAEPKVLSDLTAARQFVQELDMLWLQFNCSADSLGLPFELLYDGNAYLSLEHILTRRLILNGAGVSRKPEPFHIFMKNLIQRNELLRVLIVGANSDGSIPQAEQEALAIAKALETDLQRLGIKHHINPLIGKEASYTNVRRELSKRSYHIFHYAGHGRFDDTRPEVSGLILYEDYATEPLTASDLSLLVQNSALQIVCLSCCLGARTATTPDWGHLRGMLEALARTDVPSVLGYRWMVRDDSARELALNFYHSLWRYFSPGEAMLKARHHAAMSRHKLDESSWLAPILLVQNAS